MTAPGLRSGDLVFLIAGEPSGDALGARLMAALKRATGGSVRFAGVGGQRMEAEGLRSLFPLSDIAVMGFTEVAPRLPTLLRRMRQAEREIWSASPAALVTIDAPSFTLRVANRVRASGVPVVHYVAPQLWAWRPGRARKLAERVDRLLALLPFEPEFFKGLGLSCDYVGHPALEDALNPPPASAFAARHGLSPDAKIVLVMPGSRAGLAARMTPVFMSAFERVAARVPGLHAVLPTVGAAEPVVRRAVAGWRAAHTIVTDVTEKREAFAAARAALTISGTATLELAIAEIPMVVAYQVNRFTEFLVRRMIRVSHVSLPNLIAGREIVPEMLQADCTPERLADTLGSLLTGVRGDQKRDLAEVSRRLGVDEMRVSGVLPSDRAAKAVLEAIAERRRRG